MPKYVEFLSGKYILDTDYTDFTDYNVVIYYLEKTKKSIEYNEKWGRPRYNNGEKYE